MNMESLTRSILLSNELTRVGYGSNISLYPKEGHSDWKIAFGRPKPVVNDLYSEGVEAARQLSQTYGASIDILYSGGLDSEFAVHCFKKAGVSFKVVTLEFSNDLNSHDLVYVNKFKLQNPHLNYVTKKIDIEDFLKSNEAMRLAEISLCTLPHLLMLMKIASENLSPLVLCTGEPYLKKTANGWCLREREAIASLYRFFKVSEAKGTCAFFQSTNELFYSYLKDPVMQKIAADSLPGKQSSMSSRAQLYSQYVFCEERTKYHGYEKIESQINEIQLRLEQQFQQYRHIQYFPYEELIQALGDSQNAQA